MGNDKKRTRVEKRDKMKEMAELDGKWRKLAAHDRDDKAQLEVEEKRRRNS